MNFNCKLCVAICLHSDVHHFPLEQYSNCVINPFVGDCEVKEKEGTQMHSGKKKEI